MTPRTALIVGASGLVGGHCLRALLDDADYGRVTALGRKPISTEHPKLRSHVIDFEAQDTYRPHTGANDVFCCLGTTIAKAGSRDAFRRVDFDYPVAIAAAALANGADQLLIISALGASPRARAFYSRVKGELEAAVATMGFRAVQIFRPSLLVGRRTESRPTERFALAFAMPLSFVLVGRLRRYRPIEASAVAECMVRTAKRGTAGVHVFESEQIAEL